MDIKVRTMTGFYKAFFASALLYLMALPYLHFPLTTLLKPLPICCLMLLSLYSQLKVWHKTWLCMALVFSAAGDILLTLSFPQTFELGLFCFLLAHVAYIVLFGSDPRQRALKKAVFFIAYIAVFFSSGLLFMALSPFLKEMHIPVALYMIVISTMAIMAIRHNSISACGAVLFMLSDSLLAFNQFIFSEGNASFSIMLSYYSAQLLLVAGFIKTKAARNAFSLQTTPIRNT